MDFYSIIIFILRQFLGIPLSWCVTVKIPNPPFPLPTDRTTPRPHKQNFKWHAHMHPPTHTKTMMIVSAKDDCNSAWVYDSTSFVRNILAKIVWKEGDGIGKSWQGMNKNPWAYHCSDRFSRMYLYQTAWQFGVVKNQWEFWQRSWSIEVVA